MAKIYRYSRTKFSSFSQTKQFKVILELLSVLEKNIADAEYRELLIPSLLDCLKWSADDIRNQFPPLLELTPEVPPHKILTLITDTLRVHKPHYNAGELEINRYDGMHKDRSKKVPFPITIIADNLRSQYNLGAIYRTAECVQAAWIYFCGITPFPPSKAFMKSAMGTGERVQHTVASTENAIRWSREKGLPVIALETVAGAKCLFDFKPTQPVAVILGNEALGIEEEILRRADEILYIPVFGWKNSLNVSNAFAVAAYWLSGISSENDLT